MRIKSHIDNKGVMFFDTGYRYGIVVATYSGDTAEKVAEYHIMNADVECTQLMLSFSKDGFVMFTNDEQTMSAMIPLGYHSFAKIYDPEGALEGGSDIAFVWWDSNFSDIVVSDEPPKWVPSRVAVQLLLRGIV